MPAAQKITVSEPRSQPTAATFDAGGPVGALHQEINNRFATMAGTVGEWNHYSRPVAHTPMIENVKTGLAVAAGVGIGGLAIMLMIV